jgi:hypothetical protein
MCVLGAQKLSPWCQKVLLGAKSYRLVQKAITLVQKSYWHPEFIVDNNTSL